MAKQKRGAVDQDRAGMTGVDRLRLRVSAMINSPKAQADRRTTIWKLDSDADVAWRQVLEELAETDGLTMTANEDGTVLLEWEATDESDPAWEEMAEPADFVVQHLHEEPAPF